MYKHYMSPMLWVQKRLAICAFLLASSSGIFAQTSVTSAGAESSLLGTLPGDQVLPQISVNALGGYLVWQDNALGGGLGIGATRLNRDFSPVPGSSIRVNRLTVSDREKPKVATLNNGSTIVVWQGPGKLGPDIFAGFIGANGVVSKTDLAVNTFKTDAQSNPDVAALQDGNAAVVWQSFKQDGSLFGVYGQRFSPAGGKLGREFRVAQATNYNQRTPVVAGLANGSFLVAWVSEQQRFQNSVDLFGRIFGANGLALGDEFLINTTSNVCANPAVTASGNGFTLAWGQKDLEHRDKSWDIVARSFDSSGVPLGPETTVNSFTYGDQYAPKVAANGTNVFIVWTSLGQDGSWEGVYGRTLSVGGQFLSDESRVNSRTISKQMHPAVAADGNSGFVVIWTSYVGGAGRFDLYAQKYEIRSQ